MGVKLENTRLEAGGCVPCVRLCRSYIHIYHRLSLLTNRGNTWQNRTELHIRYVYVPCLSAMYLAPAGAMHTSTAGYSYWYTITMPCYQVYHTRHRVQHTIRRYTSSFLTRYQEVYGGWQDADVYLVPGTSQRRDVHNIGTAFGAAAAAAEVKYLRAQVRFLLPRPHAATRHKESSLATLRTTTQSSSSQNTCMYSRTRQQYAVRCAGICANTRALLRTSTPFSYSYLQRRQRADKIRRQSIHSTRSQVGAAFACQRLLRMVAEHMCPLYSCHHPIQHLQWPKGPQDNMPHATCSLFQLVVHLYLRQVRSVALFLSPTQSHLPQPAEC